MILTAQLDYPSDLSWSRVALLIVSISPSRRVVVTKPAPAAVGVEGAWLSETRVWPNVYRHPIGEQPRFQRDDSLGFSITR